MLYASDRMPFGSAISLGERDGIEGRDMLTRSRDHQLWTVKMIDQNRSPEDHYSDDETEARREAALRYALTTPPKPHEAMRKGRGESRKKG